MLHSLSLVSPMESETYIISAPTTFLSIYDSIYPKWAPNQPWTVTTFPPPRKKKVFLPGE